MTERKQLPELAGSQTIKDPKLHTTYKTGQKKFLRIFPNVSEAEKVLDRYRCALIGDRLLHGHLYITENYFAFYSNVFGYVTKLLIPILTVEKITKEKTAGIIPNAVGIVTSEGKHIFGGLMSRDSTLAYIRTIWEKVKSEETLSGPEITELDEDSLESGESGSESPSHESVPSDTEVLTSTKFDRINKRGSTQSQTEGSERERKDSKGVIRTHKSAIIELRKVSRQSLILVGTILLLILLFLSATVLKYRINKIQKGHSLSLQGIPLSSTSQDIYGDLLQWQTHLHSQSADSINNFLDTNLNEIAKVRKSLDALSAILARNSKSPSDINATPSKTPEAQSKSESVSTSTINSNR